MKGFALIGAFNSAELCTKVTIMSTNLPIATSDEGVVSWTR